MSVCPRWRRFARAARGFFRTFVVVDTRGLETQDTEQLLAAVIELSHIREVDQVMEVVRRWARTLTGADGVTFVLREGEKVFYADEDAIGPLWKGQRFPASACISGWAIHHREAVVIEDIYADDRIPHDAYRPTFVKSLAMMPIRMDDPVGAIGAYWATHHRATERELTLLASLASASATAIHNAELLADARRAARVREDFLAIASHELRTPLTALNLQINGIERLVTRSESLDPTEMLAKLTGLRQSGVRMNDLIEHMLTSIETMRGKLVLMVRRFDLSKLVRLTCDQYVMLALRAGSRIDLDAPETLPIMGDEERLGIAVSNLLSNAIKFGERRPIEVRLEPSADGGARLTVRDQGIGIASKDHERIFDPFERGVSSKNYGGFGVGLWAARKMVEAHGGTIGVQSALGAGASFVLELGRDVQASAVG